MPIHKRSGAGLVVDTDFVRGNFSARFTSTTVGHRIPAVGVRYPRHAPNWIKLGRNSYYTYATNSMNLQSKMSVRC